MVTAGIALVIAATLVRGRTTKSASAQANSARSARVPVAEHRADRQATDWGWSNGDRGAAALHGRGGLCGTEIQPLDADAAPMRIPGYLRSLTQRVPSANDIRQAIEDMGPSVADELDLAELTDSALEARAAAERELAEMPPVGTHDDQEAAQDWLDRVDRFRDLGQVDDSLKAAREAHRLAPDFASTERLATALDETNQPDQARRLLEQAIETTSDSNELAWLWGHLGYVCSERGDQDCVQRAEQSIETHDEDGLAVFLRGIHQGDLGQFESAQATFAGRVETVSDFPTVANLALVRTALGMTTEAKQGWSDALDLASSPRERTTVLSGLGEAYLREGDTQMAWIAGAAALSVAAKSATASAAHEVLALTAVTVGDLEEARAQVKRARDANPYDDLVRTNWFAHPAEKAAISALVAEASGDLDKAREAWLAVARSDHPKLGYAARQALSGMCPRS